MFDDDRTEEENREELDSPGPGKFIKAALIALLQAALVILYAWAFLSRSHLGYHIFSR